MRVVIEFIREAIAIYNLPFTALLGAVLFYWVLVLIGALDFDFDLFDFGDGGADLPDVHTSHAGGFIGGAMLSVGRVFGFSQVPIAIWGSFFALFLWVGSMLLNYRFNGTLGDRSLTTAALLLIPGGIASLVLTKLITLPFAKLFAAMSGVNTESLMVLNQVGVVTTTVLDHEHGQVQIESSGAPALINARLRADGPTLRKGDHVRVTETHSEGLFYYVEPHHPNTLP